MRKFIGIFILLDVINFLAALTPLSKTSQPRIVVVGAGASGIAAAVKLLEFGFQNVTVLEAEPRLGGRIHTIPFGENVVDMGAEWCHGEAGNVVYEMAYEHGLLEHPNEMIENRNYIRSSGEVLPVWLKKRLENITQCIKEKRAEELRNCSGGMGAYLRNEFYEILKLPENKDIDKEIATEFYHTFEMVQCVDEAADSLDDISARDYNLFEEIDGDYALMWKDKGYKEFLRLLLKCRETGKEFGVLEAHLRLSKKVSRINWQRDDGKALVECEDGEEIEADHVIVTVSLGVLKANLHSMFEPPLPTQKQKVIAALEFGTFGKIFLEFPKRFWSEKMGTVYFLWQKKELEDLKSTTYAWLESIYGFNSVPYQPQVLEAWFVGPNARSIEKLPLEDIQAGSLYLLHKFLAVEIPEPKNVTISKWFTNPNTRGCYSYHSLETEKANLSNEHLAEAIRINCNSTDKLCEKPILQFAGEATNSLHYATVHGAVESGFREAEMLNNIYGK